MCPASITHITDLNHYLVIKLSSSFILCKIFIFFFHIINRLFWLDLILWFLFSSILFLIIILGLLTFFVDVNINFIYLFTLYKCTIVFLVLEALIINLRS